MITSNVFHEKSIILLKQNTSSITGSDKFIWPKGHKGHNMAPQWLGRLTEPERAR